MWPQSGSAGSSTPMVPVSPATPGKGQKRKASELEGSPPVGSPTPGSPFISGMGALTCRKCLETTTMRDSQPAGSKNPLLRNCNGCESVDAALNRKANMSKRRKLALSDDDKLIEQEAKATKKHVEGLDPISKSQWYKDEKAKRALEDKTSKRTFQRPTATQKQGTVSHVGAEDLDHFETEEDWIAKKMILKLIDTYEAGRQAFREECKKPESVTMERRGQTLLCKYKGVQAARGSRTELEQAVQWNKDLDSKEDLDEFNSASSSMERRFDRSIKSEGQDFTVRGSKVPAHELHNGVDFSSFVPSLHIMGRSVLQDLEKKRLHEEEVDAKMLQEAIEAHEEAQAKKAEQAKHQREKKDDKLVSIIRMEVASVIKNALGKCATSVETQDRNATAAGKECEAFLEQLEKHGAEGVNELKNETQTDIAKIAPLVAKVSQAIETRKNGWLDETKAKDSTDELEAMKEEAINFAKHFCSSDENYKSLKAASGKVGTLKNTLKKELTKVEKEAIKSQAKNQQSLRTSDTAAVPAVIEQLRKHISSLEGGELPDKNLRWVAKELFTSGDSGDLRAVKFPANRTEDLRKEITGMEYYGKQKEWVSDTMTKQKLMSAPAGIVKPQVARTIKKGIDKYLDEVKTMTSSGHALADEAIAPKFYQHAKGYGGAWISNDFGLVDVRMTLEGSERVFGIPYSALAGPTIEKKTSSLESMTAQQVLRLAEDKGFIFTSKPGDVHVVPGCFAQIVFADELDDYVGLRWKLYGTKFAAITKFAHEFCQSAVTENATLEAGAFGSVKHVLTDVMNAPEEELD